MSYVDILREKYGDRIGFHTEELLEACAEVDRMRERESKHAEKYLAEHADLRARLAVAEQSEKDCRQIIDTYVDETDALQKRLAVADAAQAAVREELADLKLVREGCKEVAADVIKAVERRYGDGFGVPANLKTEIITIIAANLWTGHTDAEKFATEQALAALREDRERIMQSYEYCVNRSLKHIADNKPTLAVCVLEARQKSLNEKRAEMQAALHPATKEGKA